MKCKICKFVSKFEKFNSYKHTWYFCIKCKNIFSEAKKKDNNIIKIFFIKLIAIITNQERVYDLLLNRNIKKNKFYEYYNKIIEKNKQGKWKNYDRVFLNYLKKNKISLRNKSILSVSDEPGFIALHLKKYTNKITLTALDPTVAKSMSKRFNCDVKCYDINKDKLSKILKKKYDLIFFRSTLNYNLDFENLVNETYKISKNKCICIFNYNSVSLSSCLMWMFDDYTFKSFLNQSYIENLLKNKFLIYKKSISRSNPRIKYYNNFKKKLFYYPFFLFYYLEFKIKNLFFKFNMKFNPYEEKVNLILKKV